MTTIDSADIWESPPPSDVEALSAWLLEREEEAAESVRLTLTRIIEDAYTVFLSTLTASGDMSAFDSIPPQWERYVTEDLGGRIGGMYSSGAVSAWVQAPGTEALTEGTVRSWTRLQNQQASAYIQTATNRLTGGVGANVWNDVKNKVSDALARGASTQELRDDIVKLGQFSAARAEVIARTEMNGAYAAGVYEGAASLGEYGPVEKYWIATQQPSRTRASHLAADNGISIPFDQPFEVGGAQMMRPLDPAGPAKEVVNCRCRLGLLYEGMTRPDGTIVERPQPVQPTVQPPVERRPTIPSTGFADSSEALNYLRRRHPQIVFDDELVLFDRRTLTSVARWAEDMEDRYPDSWGRMKYVGTQSEDGNFFEQLFGFQAGSRGNYDWTKEDHLAHAYMDRKGHISINPKYGQNYDLFLEAIERSRKTGFFFGESIEDVLTHEFGHAVHGFERTSVLLDYHKRIVWSKATTRGGSVSTLHTLEVDLLKKIQGRVNGLSGSRYSGHNEYEAYAESFLAAHQGRNLDLGAYNLYKEFIATMDEVAQDFAARNTAWTGADTKRLRKRLAELSRNTSRPASGRD